MKKNKLIPRVLVWVLIAMVTSLLPYRILAGYSIMLHESAHKNTAETYGLHPIYSPSFKTFFSWNFRPAAVDTTNFTEEDQQKIRAGGLQMQKEILLAGINADLAFAKWVIFSSFMLVLIGTTLGILAYKMRSKKLGIITLVCAYLLLITVLWLHWELTGSMPYNLHHPSGDLQKLIALARGAL